MIEYDIRTKQNRDNQIKVRVNWLIRDNWKGKNEQSRIRLVRRYKIEKLFPELSEEEIVECLRKRISRRTKNLLDNDSLSKISLPINIPKTKIESIKRDLKAEDRFYFVRNWCDPLRKSMMNDWMEMSGGGEKSCLRD